MRLAKFCPDAVAQDIATVVIGYYIVTTLEQFASAKCKGTKVAAVLLLGTDKILL